MEQLKRKQKVKKNNMAKYKDILGNERAVADETVTISLERYNQLIIMEAEYNKTQNKICVNKESEDK